MRPRRSQVAKELNTLHRRAGVVRTVLPRAGQLRDGREHDRRDASDERLPGDLRHPARSPSPTSGPPAPRAGRTPISSLRRTRSESCSSSSCAASLSGVVLLFVISDRRVRAALPRQRQHRPPHPRPERHRRARRAEDGGARTRPPAARAVRRLAHLGPHRRLRPLMVQRPAGLRQPLRPSRGDPLARDRRDARVGDHLRRARRPRRPSRRLGRRRRAVHLRARLRDPRLPDRARTSC